MFRFPPPKAPPAPRVVARWVPPTSAAVEVEPSISAQHVFTLTLENVLDEDGDPFEVTFSTKAMIVDGEVFSELVVDPGTIKRQVFGGSRTPGVVAPTWGSIEFQNTAEEFDPWLDYATDGAKVTCRYGVPGDVYPGAFRTVYIAYIDGDPVLTKKACRFNIRGRERLFDAKVVTQGFTDDTGSYLSIDLERAGVPGSRLQQIVMGTPGYFAPILLNDLENVWFVQANAVEAGVPEVFDGGVELTYAGELGVGGGGQFGLLTTSTGIFIKPVTDIRIEARARTTGLISGPDITPRRWNIVDLAKRAGVVGVDENEMPAGSTVFDAGNRLVENQSYKDVLNDICAFEVASIGFNRLDQFYAKPIVPSFDGASVYTFRDGGTFRDGNSRDWSFAKVPGLEKRVWQVRVQSGETRKSALAGVVDDDIKDALSREPWNVEFVGNWTYNSGTPFFQASTILDTDPTSESAEVQIVGNEFTSEAVMEAWTERYMKLFGSKQVACSLETEFNFETLVLEPLDKVLLQSDRFGGAREAVIWQTELQLKQRKIRFGCWSQLEATAPGVANGVFTIDQANTTSGAGGGGTGSGGTGRGDGQAAVQYETFAIACSDKTTALTAATLVQDFMAPYDMSVIEVAASLYTVQASGSTFTVDVNDDGVTCLSTKLTIDNGEYSSVTAAVQPVISVPTILKGSKVTFDIDALGTGAKGITVFLLVYRLR